MSTHRHVRVEVEGIGLNGRRETFTTSIIASDADRARGAHIEEAHFRANVWGLRAPLRIVGEHGRHGRRGPRGAVDSGPSVAAQRPRRRADGARQSRPTGSAVGTHPGSLTV